MTAPLDGIRVVEAARFITGPHAAMLLADLGAEVIKVEQPGEGDPFRSWIDDGPSPRFIAHNRSKRSVALDLGIPAARDAFLRLVDTADVFVENFRPGVTERLGIDYPTLSARNPRLVYCSITGFGEDGPYARRASYDGVGQAMSGLMGLLTDLHDPQPVGPALSDTLSGVFAAYAILGALHGRHGSGRGQHVKTSMLQATVSFLVEQATDYFCTGEIPDRFTRARQSQSYSFTAGDGRPFIVHLSTPSKFWEALVAVVGHPELAADPRFREYGARVRNYETLRAELGPLFGVRSREAWLSELAKADVPCAPVYDLAEVFDDAQVRRLGMRVRLPSAGAEPVWTVGLPATLDDLPEAGSVPALGEHTVEVLRGIGLTDAELALLARPRGWVPKDP